ncbi:PaREP1 family protein [Candidatus Bathyarchaeota archaeon]|nr:PaREP1 family protein [Candidatus Bathyarchaeota archaeon]
MSVSISLPRSIFKEIEGRAWERGATIEYLIEALLRDSDPSASATVYLEGALQLLEQAEQELERGDLRQASEKIWGACALAIKAHALSKRGKRIESHRELWSYKNEVADEIGGWVRITFKLADSMHKNFYEDLATREDVEDVLKDVEKLVKAVELSIKSRAGS